ncbi:SH3 domain-containing protein [Metabacillus fastidiosus]|uniref:SH3 domain-containing protein n=1 Tax=Metabacillus fastidiosus TaxID=1458 RepID=A0ABU6NXR1_9BACI|nr:SH3 domain-containing protein [Metabacillus fastidiosus]
MFRKNTFISALIIFIIMNLFTLSFISYADSTKVKSNVDDLNVRSGPGLTYSVVATLKKGESYEVLKKQNDWLQLKVAGNKKGWVASWLVTESGNNKNTKASSSSTVIESTATGLRVRQGPGTSFPTVTVFEKGTKAVYISKSGSWIQISLNGKEGWVLSSHVKYNTNKSSSSAVKTGMIKGNSINIRKTPSTNGSVIGKMNNGANINIISEQGKWMEIRFNNNKGWVHSDYVTFTKENPKQNTDNKKLGTVTVTSLKVRTKGTLDSNIIDSITKGTKVTILEEKSNWYKISYSGKKTGWVSSSYIAKDGQEKAPSTSSTNKVKILYNGTNVRSGPATTNSVVKRVDKDEQFPIISTSGNWYKINLGNNKTGFVAGWVVETNGGSNSVNKPGVQQYLQNKTIIIDAGHGGRDSGTIGIRGTLEKNLTLKTANLVYNKLKASGANVFLTRSNDTYVSLTSRVSTTHYRTADAFVSIHYDSASNSSTRGVSTFYYNSLKDQTLAKAIQKELVKETNFFDRGIRFGNFHVLRENNRPSVLIELGFLSNRTEEITMNTAGYQEKASQAIYYGLSQYFK